MHHMNDSTKQESASLCDFDHYRLVDKLQGHMRLAARLEIGVPSWHESFTCVHLQAITNALLMNTSTYTHTQVHAYWLHADTCTIHVYLNTLMYTCKHSLIGNVH